MNETAAPTKDQAILLDALDRFGIDNLARLLKLFDDVRAETGFGRLELTVRDGHIYRLDKTVYYKAR